ncbi:MAG: tetratricopeptide repeat protein [Chlorobi bacterium]|nr:tetratricopeptide repeat protein [Chlorobiota bacterium]
MRKYNFKALAFVVLAAVLSGCAGLQKMKKNANQIQFKVTPEVLEANGGKVDVAIDGKFPAKYFIKKATLVATPVLKYEGGETALEPVTLQGEKVEANNKVINYINGGSYSYKDDVKYIDDMSLSDLEIRIKASKGSKSIDFAPIKIANGVIATSTLLVNRPKPILGIQREKNTTGKYDPNIDAFQRIVPDELMADIHYLINRANLRKSEINSDDIKKLKEYTKDAYSAERKKLKGVEISAYASPDGTLEFNADLAEKREETSSSYISKELEKEGVETGLKARYTPEDWEGFKKLMEKSNIQDKELILRVLSMYKDPEVREREIKNLSAAFTAVAEEILPRLRRAKIVTSIDLIGKTDEEIAALAESNPASLNPAELLYAATLTEDLGKQLSIYKSFIKVYPSDWRGPNNAGFVLVKQNKYDDARPLFEKAEQLKNDEPIIKNNLGAVALHGGNIQKAEELFGAAAGAGDEVNYNLGMVSVKKAEYDKAVRYFKKEADVNTALAKILTGDNNGALKDLESTNMPGCFMKEYLKAVIGARTAKESLLFDSLAKAVDMNPDLKAKAKKDMEFAKYFTDSKFIAIVE